MPSNHILDISRPLHPGMAIYPRNPPTQFETIQEAEGHRSALTHIHFGSHTGTHIDAPAHVKANDPTTDVYPLEQLCGECEVIDVTNVTTVIQATDLPATTTPRLIIKTRNSRGSRNHFDPDFVALSEEAAHELVKRGLVLVGIDALSIKKQGVHDRVHALLLDVGIVILEGLWLPTVQPGLYELLCLPLPVALDGAPARAVLRTH